MALHYNFTGATKWHDCQPCQNITPQLATTEGWYCAVGGHLVDDHGQLFTPAPKPHFLAALTIEELDRLHAELCAEFTEVNRVYRHLIDRHADRDDIRDLSTELYDLLGDVFVYVGTRESAELA